MSHQPDKDASYNVEGNAASKQPAESSNASQPQSGSQVEQRIPQEQTTSIDEATPSSSGRGIRGAGPGEKESEISEFDQGRSHADDAEQMGAPGEGKVADAVKGNEARKTDVEQKGLESDLDRKKAEQAPQREAQKEEQKKEVDVAGALGQRGGPANPVS